MSVLKLSQLCQQGQDYPHTKTLESSSDPCQCSLLLAALRAKVRGPRPGIPLPENTLSGSGFPRKAAHRHTRLVCEAAVPPQRPKGCRGSCCNANGVRGAAARGSCIATRLIYSRNNPWPQQMAQWKNIKT